MPLEETVRIKGLHVAFRGRPVLQGIDLGCFAGTLTVVVGRSGSGKTTLLRSINRLNECFPGCRTAGTVRLALDGIDVDVYSSQIPVTELRRRVGMVFQTPNLLPVSVGRNLELPLKLVAGLDNREIPEHLERALRSAHLWEEVKDRLRDPAASLSGGQQQRLCLARTLALQPDVLLLDEPTASLDVRAAEKIEALLLELKQRLTLVAVSHSLRQARSLADRIAVLDNGTISRTLDRAEFEDAGRLDAVLREVF